MHRKGGLDMNHAMWTSDFEPTRCQRGGRGRGPGKGHFGGHGFEGRGGWDGPWGGPMGGPPPWVAQMFGPGFAGGPGGRGRRGPRARRGDVRSAIIDVLAQTASGSGTDSPLNGYQV